MAKEDYIFVVLLLVHLIPHLLCSRDDAENAPSTEEYYDYNTELPMTTTTDSILIQTLRSHSLINENVIRNNSVKVLSNSYDNNVTLQNRYIHSNSFTSDNNFNSNNTSKLPQEEKHIGNITVEFSDAHILINAKNTEYEVDHKTELNINSRKNNTHGIPIQVKINDDPPHPCARKCIEGEQPMTCYYKFNIEWYYAMSKACFNCSTNESDCYRPHCIPTNGIKRPLIVVNRKLPGPSIEVCLGDRVIVDVHNHLMEESTSIHWHGHHQRGSPYMDGVPFITQCPIPPHTTFRYNYLAATPGTHFWHSHSGCQRTDGVVGNMVIRVPKSQDPHSHLYDEDLSEHVINIMDWAHELGISMFVAHYHSDGDNKPESILVNGKGRYFVDSMNITSTPLAIFTVKKDLRYRFRIINAGNQNCPIQMSIDNHTITTINSDGGNFEPVEGNALVTYAGERWDFILKATGDIKNYWIRFKGLMDCDERFTKAHQVAILRYEGAPEEEPHEHVSYFGPEKKGLTINAMNVRLDNPETRSMPELSAIDIDNDPSLKQNADHQFYIGYDFYPVNANNYHKPTLYGFMDVKNRREQVYTPQFNHISMKMPAVPLLSQRDSVSSDMFCNHKSLTNCTDNEQCECTNVIEIPLGDVVELILIDEGNTYNANHPFHLHGHPFRVIAMDRLGENTSIEIVRNLDKAGQIWRNLKNAPLKDSVTVPDGGYTIVRFHATNPGYWLFHCHLEFHVEVGMALIFKIGEHSQFPPVPEGFPTCGDYLFPILPEEITKNKAIMENEVNFGDDYGIRHNTTNHNEIKYNEKKKDPFNISQLLSIHSAASSTVISVVRYQNTIEYLLTIFTYTMVIYYFR